MIRIVFALFLSQPVVSSLADLYNPIYCGPSPLWYSDIMVSHASHLIRTYHDVTGGKELVSMKILEKDPTEAAKLLFFLPNRVVVSHGTQNDSEGPVLNYGNSAALKRWGASWEELTNMPSKYTAETVEQTAREEFLRKVFTDGVVENYSGVRIGLDKSRYLAIYMMLYAIFCAKCSASFWLNTILLACKLLTRHDKVPNTRWNSVEFKTRRI